MARRNTIYQAFGYTHTVQYLEVDEFLIGLSLHMRFVDDKNKTKKR